MELGRYDLHWQACPKSDWNMSQNWFIKHVRKVIEACPKSDWNMSQNWFRHVPKIIQAKKHAS